MACDACLLVCLRACFFVPFLACMVCAACFRALGLWGFERLPFQCSCACAPPSRGCIAHASSRNAGHVRLKRILRQSPLSSALVIATPESHLHEHQQPSRKEHVCVSNGASKGPEVEMDQGKRVLKHQGPEDSRSENPR